MGVNFRAVKDMFAWIGPVLAALQGNQVCDANPSCADTRIQFQKLVDARNDGQLDDINTLAQQLQGVEDRQTLNTAVNRLNAAMASVARAAKAMGLDRPGGPQAGWLNCSRVPTAWRAAAGRWPAAWRNSSSRSR